jgi:hypothetical protein
MDALRSMKWTVARAGIGRSFLGYGFRRAAVRRTARRSLRGCRRLLSRLDVTPASDRVTAERERLKGGPVKLGVNGPSFLRTWLGLATVAFL